MQVYMVKKKKHIIPYILVLLVAFCGTTRLAASASNISVEYTGRTAKVGWKDTSNSATSTRFSLDDSNQALDALKIKVNGSYSGGISYTVHTIDGGWLDWSKDGSVLEDSSDKNFNAIKIDLYGDISKQYDIKYRVLTSENVWSDWGSNKEQVGDTSSKYEIIDIEIDVEEKDTAISSFTKFVKNVTTPESVLDYGEEETTTIAEESVPTAGEPNATATTSTTAAPSSNELKKLDKALKGIDVSYYNGNIDWTKVKADGINFAIIQIGYRGCSLGTLKADTSFEKNIQGAIDAGINVGIYYVTQAKNEAEAKEEANYVLSKISNYTIQYPIYIDIEEVKNSRCKKMNNEQRTTVCKTFCDTIKAAGYHAGIYSCKYWFDSKLNTNELANYNIWCAVYEQKSKPNTNFPYQIWQCSETGKVSGITGNVDINYCYYDYPNYAPGEPTATISPVSNDANADPNKAVG